MILLANLLTLSRIPLAILFWLVVHQPGWAMAVMVVGGLTDVIDGPIARHARRHQTGRPDPGPPGVFSWLDPFCDKFFVLSVLAGTYVARDVPAGVLLAVAAREMVQIPLAAVYRFTPWLRSRMRYDFTAGPIGKAATVAQFAAIAAILSDHPARGALSVVAAIIGLCAAIHYVARGVRLARAQPSPARAG